MKLEKVVSRPRKGLWVFLFVLGLAVAGTMATSYNVQLIRDFGFRELPWTRIIAGSLGFVGIMGALVLFFARLLREMRISQIQADFLDRISHELRTPISTLMLVSDLLRPSPDSLAPEEARLWRSHALELERLKTDVELLLQAAKLRESRLRVNPEKVDLDNWIRSRREEFRRLLGDRADLAITGGPVGSAVLLDAGLLELIFRNLLDNARKFAIGEPRVEIRLEVFRPRLFPGRSRWRISIIDQGMGFSPRQKRALFRRFSRLQVEDGTLLDRSIPGTGLGLYLSASAAKGMGLTLRGNSPGEGRGARFVLEGRLP